MAEYPPVGLHCAFGVRARAGAVASDGRNLLSVALIDSVSFVSSQAACWRMAFADQARPV